MNSKTMHSKQLSRLRIERDIQIVTFSGDRATAEMFVPGWTVRVNVGLAERPSATRYL